MDDFDSNALGLAASALAVIAHRIEPEWWPKRIGAEGKVEYYNPVTGDSK